jgi:hypothetical protein
MSIFWAWLTWLTSARLLGGLEHVDDRCFRIARIVLDAGDEELRRALLGACKHRLDRLDVALPFGCLRNRLRQLVAVALADHRAKDDLPLEASTLRALRELGESVHWRARSSPPCPRSRSPSAYGRRSA